jgi:hypothetical protein
MVLRLSVIGLSKCYAEACVHSHAAAAAGLPRRKGQTTQTSLLRVSGVTEMQLLSLRAVQLYAS